MGAFPRLMQYELERHDLAALIRSALEEFEAPAREGQASIQTQLPDEPVLVDCDGQRVRQVVGNLLPIQVRRPLAGSIEPGYRDCATTVPGCSFRFANSDEGMAGPAGTSR